jgi:hypothetical protein
MDEKPGKPFQFGMLAILGLTSLVAILVWVERRSGGSREVVWSWLLVALLGAVWLIARIDRRGRL